MSKRGRRHSHSLPLKPKALRRDVQIRRGDREIIDTPMGEGEGADDKVALINGICTNWGLDVTTIFSDNMWPKEPAYKFVLRPSELSDIHKWQRSAMTLLTKPLREQNRGNGDINASGPFDIETLDMFSKAFRGNAVSARVGKKKEKRPTRTKTILKIKQTAEQHIKVEGHPGITLYLSEAASLASHEVFPTFPRASTPRPRQQTPLVKIGMSSATSGTKRAEELAELRFRGVKREHFEGVPTPPSAKRVHQRSTPLEDEHSSIDISLALRWN